MKPQAIIVMGVSGCGKSTVGSALAVHLGAKFLDADDFHPQENKEKMRAGLALNDADRLPWLKLLNQKLVEETRAGKSVVLACSALKEKYRELLRSDLPALTLVYLEGTHAELAARLAARNHEYMPSTLLQSQLDTLEPPREALQIPIAWPVEKQVAFAANSILSHNIVLGV